MLMLNLQSRIVCGGKGTCVASGMPERVKGVFCRESEK